MNKQKTNKFTPIKGRIEVNSENAGKVLVTQQVVGLYEGLKEHVQNAIDSTDPTTLGIIIKPIQLIVNDNGFGMPFNEVRENYLKFFNSTKGKGFIGSMGIGAKALIGEENVREILVTTISAKTQEKTEFNMWLQNGEPWSIIASVSASNAHPGTTVKVQLKTAIDFRKRFEMRDQLYYDTLLVKPNVTIVTFAEKGKKPVVNRIGGIEMETLTKANSGTYIRTTAGEAAIMKITATKNKAAAEDTAISLSQSSGNIFYTVSGFRVLQKHLSMSEYVAMVNLFEAKRVISSSDLVQIDKDKADKLFEKLVEKTIPELFEKNRKDALELIRHTAWDNKYGGSFNTINLPKSIAKFPLYAGFKDGKAWLSISDIQDMATDSGYLFYVPHEESTNLAGKMRLSNIPFISDKNVYFLLDGFTSPEILNVTQPGDLAKLYQGKEIAREAYEPVSNHISSQIVSSIAEVLDRTKVDFNLSIFVRKFNYVIQGEKSLVIADTSTIACNSNGQVMLNFNSNTIQSLYEVARINDSELKRTAILLFVSDVLFHERQHNNDHLHDDDFHDGVDSQRSILMQSMMRDALDASWTNKIKRFLRKEKAKKIKPEVIDFVRDDLDEYE